ncbi:unnamed protein product [Coffea canephora]|uniref:beta-glucosidase n=1 Tax=Coffea canephora TaxID=49390 RepID=A0A068UQ23_COFCA|nr:unnamed protein product [Coffea canephora]
MFVQEFAFLFRLNFRMLSSFCEVKGMLMVRMARSHFFVVGILVLCCWTVKTKAEYMRYKDPKQPVDVRVKDLMSRMTLAEKIGQMSQIDRVVASAEVVRNYYIGSVFNGGESLLPNRATPETWMDMVNEFQKGALSTRLGIPIIYGIDAIHGNNDVYGATVFPHNIGLGAARQVAF